MNKLTFAAASIVAASTVLPLGSIAGPQKGQAPNTLFQHVGTFDVMAGNGSAVAEIVDVTKNGKHLIYTDADHESIGFVDISNPAVPTGEGTLDVGGEPTSLVILDPLVLVAVNTSESFADPSGKLVVVHRHTRQIVAEYDLGGQPDSIALAPDKKRVAIVIENERDEDLDGGLLPQAPSGTLLIAEIWGAPQNWTIFEADLTPVADNAYGEGDLEAEFVDINRQNEAVVTFQENNHLAIVDMVTGQTLNEFSAGSVELSNIDTVEDDLIRFTDTVEKRREPDAVAWIDNDTFATANEGDYEDENGEGGGSRGFTLFNQDGTVEYESAESFEHWIASMGHYNEGRSENKGCEPESVEYGTFGRQKLLFIGSERANAVGVYDVSRGMPKPVQVLPTGIGPEGLKAIPKRDLFVASTEKDEADAGIPTMINIFKKNAKHAFYPMIQSANDENGTPIPWVALSGLAGDPRDGRTIYGVSDSFLAEGYIYTIDVSKHPAQITQRTQVVGASEALDLEGIAVGRDGLFWLASEGNADDRPNMILKVAPDGTVLEEINLPAALEDNARKNGFEGVAVVGAPGEEVVYAVIQRAWPDTGDIDKEETKIARYDTVTGEWTFAYYPLEMEGEGGWVGLSEITHLFGGIFAIIERDKGWGPTTGLNAELKAVYGVRLNASDFRAYDDPNGLVTIEKRLLRDVQPMLDAASVWTPEKLEGLAVSRDGRVYVVTDNDGMDDAPGETVFLRIH